MTSRDIDESRLQLAEALEQMLVERHGLMLTGEDLRRALGYRSADAFRQALVRATVPVPVFPLEGRRGKFALAKDVAAWAAAQRDRAVTSPRVRKHVDEKKEGDPM